MSEHVLSMRQKRLPGPFTSSDEREREASERRLERGRKETERGENRERGGEE